MVSPQRGPRCFVASRDVGKTLPIRVLFSQICVSTKPTNGSCVKKGIEGLIHLVNDIFSIFFRYSYIYTIFRYSLFIWSTIFLDLVTESHGCPWGAATVTGDLAAAPALGPRPRSAVGPRSAPHTTRCLLGSP
jgi:hypothetical protein